ncbi:MAG: 2-amino-4-hydroxy-6-hydroxymethyldihydropteridine diphosphokinase [Rhodocyclaceae bacterium]|nr:2-amino-4-hydroxy-6-hydroxymethyldihydropteridine diphosphokinase [Rhodocyclaceae bacterium]
MKDTLAYVALGANLGDPIATVMSAVERLAALPHAEMIAASSLYRTAPLGLKNQPDFINAVALLRVDSSRLPAPALLAALFAIETEFGRVRSIKNAPRTLDLDLLLYGEEQWRTPTLTLPHPRMAERAFVLAPLAEIAPHLSIPDHGSVSELLPTLAHQRVEKLT